MQVMIDRGNVGSKTKFRNFSSSDCNELMISSLKMCIYSEDLGKLAQKTLRNDFTRVRPSQVLFISVKSGQQEKKSVNCDFISPINETHNRFLLSVQKTLCSTDVS